MRKIPKKNYVIFAVVIIVSLFLVGYFVRWYQMTNGREEPIMMDGVVSEVRYDELTSYLQDNPNVIVYIAPNIQGSNIALENDLKKYIVNHNLADEFIYLDSNKIQDSQIYNDFEDDYLSDELKRQSVDLSVTPNLWYFRDGVIVDVMNTVSRTTSIQDVEHFLEENEAY